MFGVISDVAAPVQDRTFRCPKREGDAEPWFTPGSAEVDDPLRQTTNTTQHFYIIYPRRDLATLISACYPVVNGAVVMRYKPVFTTAGSQPYGGVPLHLPLLTVVRLELWLNRFL